MEKSTVKDIFDKFVDDKFADAEEQLKNAFRQDRDVHLRQELGLADEEKEEPEEEEDE